MYTIPSVKGFGEKSFAYDGCTLWNPFHSMSAMLAIFLREHLLSLAEFVSMVYALMMFIVDRCILNYDMQAISLVSISIII